MSNAESRIVSKPPRGLTKITNIYWDPETSQVVFKVDPK